MQSSFESEVSKDYVYIVKKNPGIFYDSFKKVFNANINSDKCKEIREKIIDFEEKLIESNLILIEDFNELKYTIFFTAEKIAMDLVSEYKHQFVNYKEEYDESYFTQSKPMKIKFSDWAKLNTLNIATYIAKILLSDLKKELQQDVKKFKHSEAESKKASAEYRNRAKDKKPEQKDKMDSIQNDIPDDDDKVPELGKSLPLKLISSIKKKDKTREKKNQLTASLPRCITRHRKKKQDLTNVLNNEMRLS